MNLASRWAARWVALACFISAPAAVLGGEFEYTADGKVTRAGSRRTLDWETSGRVTAPDRAAAEAQAAPLINQFLAETYPGWTEVAGSRTVRVRSVAMPAGGPNHVSVRLGVHCLGYVRQEVPDLTIFNWDVITHEDVIDRFTFRLLTSRDGVDGRYEAEIRTLGRGTPGEQYRNFHVWSGDYVDGDPPMEFTVHLLMKNLPNPERFAQPPKPDPTNPNDGFTQVGAFRVRLRHEGGRLIADWKGLENATTPNRPRPGPGLLSQRFVLRTSDTVPFDVSFVATKEADLAASREAAREAERAKQEEMKRKLAAAGPGIRVFTGGAQGKAPDAQGRPGTVGVGALVLLSSDRAAAEAYLAREFPGYQNTIIATTEDEAKTALRKRFAQSFPNGKIEGEPTLRSKIGRTLLDRLQEQPPRPPRRR